jgi:hypothetical protein
MKKQTLINILTIIDEFTECNHIQYDESVILLRHTVILQYVNDNGLSLDTYYDLCDEL